MLDFEHIVDDGRPSNWERPKTTRRYLHPPKAEQLITMWAEGKIVYGDNNWYESHLTYHEEPAIVLWPAWYKYVRPFDLRAGESYQYRDGAPVHGIRFTVGGIDIEEEACAGIAESPVCFVRFRYQNRAPYPVSERFTFLIRKGSEKAIVYGAPDCYTTYLPEIGAVKDLPATFRASENVFRDGDSYIQIGSGIPFTFDESTGVIAIDLELEEGETRDVTFSIGKGEAAPFSYEEERENVLRYWDRQMERITRLPKAIRNDPEKLRIIKNLTVQFLQCLCKYTGGSYYIFRQGGLQRHIWPWDAMPALEALGRIGDFQPELDEVFSTYFNVMQQPDGGIKNLGIQWASDTGCCLYSLATYCLQKNDRSYWETYREKALRAFRWIEALRHSSYGIEGAVGGLVPPLRANDWTEILQHWTFSDPNNMNAYAALYRAAMRFHDPMADEVRAAYDDYRALYLKTLSGLVDLNGTGPVRIPLLPTGDDRQLLSSFYVYIHHADALLSLDDLLPESLFLRVKAWCESIRIYENGLYGKIPGKSGNTHIFYTTAPEYPWFFLFLRHDMRDEAEQILTSLLRYSMTKEYYMIERYDNRDPYFLPWSPNASAGGRIINMMLDLCRDPDGDATNLLPITETR